MPGEYEHIQSTNIVYRLPLLSNICLLGIFGTVKGNMSNRRRTYDLKRPQGGTA